MIINFQNADPFYSPTTTTASQITSTTTVAPATTGSPVPTVTSTARPGTTTTASPVPDSTTTTTAPTAEPRGNGFNGGSFVGGMVFSAALIAIGYFGLKFYRARNPNYRTL